MLIGHEYLDKMTVDRTPTTHRGSMTNTGNLLKNKRLELKLSQRAVAKLIGMTNVSLNYIERGQRALPAKYVNNVCQVLQLEKLTVARAMKEDQEVALEKKIR